MFLIQTMELGELQPQMQPQLLRLVGYGAVGTSVASLAPEIARLGAIRGLLASEEPLQLLTVSPENPYAVATKPDFVTMFSDDTMPHLFNPEWMDGVEESVFTSGAAPTYTSYTPSIERSYGVVADRFAPPIVADSMLPWEIARDVAPWRNAKMPVTQTYIVPMSTGPFTRPTIALPDPIAPSAEPALALSPSDTGLRITFVIDVDQVPGLRADLLRLVGGRQAVLCHTLVLVLVAIGYRPDVRNFVLVLIAASRRYGHRSEPDDHLLPANRSISVVRGELVLAY